MGVILGRRLELLGLLAAALLRGRGGVLCDLLAAFERLLAGVLRALDDLVGK